MSWLTCLFWHSTTMIKDILQTRMSWLHLKTSSRQGCHDQHIYFDMPQLHLKMIFQTRMSWLTCWFWHSTTTFKGDLPDQLHLKTIFQTRMSWLTYLFWYSTATHTVYLQTRMFWLACLFSNCQNIRPDNPWDGCHD